ncbi:MAG TPA: J domain-containing protein [Vicinamibacteria bacterium]
MDVYEVLGVRRNATAAEIRRAYQKLARLLHPDLNPGDPIAAERFRAVSRAFEVLSDPQRRAQYDRGEAPPPPPPRAAVGFAGFDFSAETRVERAGFHEIFHGVLHPAAEGPVPGEDLQQTTRVSFEECLRGTRRRVHVVRFETCGACEGRGALALRPRPCPACGGTGQLRAARGRMVFTRGCEDCAGTGVLGRQPCGQCAGEGRVRHSEWLEVQIPAGVNDGSRVRLPGWGNAGRRGGPPGDFVLSVEVEPHPVFRREGDDLFCEVPISIAEAALGAHVEVPTLDGPMTIGVPPGTQNGQRFRLRKRGMPRMEAPGAEPARGDLFVQVRVWVPSVTDDEGRRLLEEFARRSPRPPRGPAANAAAPARAGAAKA